MEGTATADLIKGMSELATFVENRLNDFEKGQHQSSSANPTVKGLSADYLAFKSMVWKTLGMLKAQLQLIVDNQDRLETHLRRKVLLFHGVAEVNDEDPLQTTLHTVNSCMKMPSITSDSIEVCHRLGVKRDDKSKPVLVQFAGMQSKSAVWKAKMALKGSDISISEFLTKSRQEVFTAARGYFGRSQCWSTDGSIYILLADKSRAKVHTMSELKTLQRRFPSGRKNTSDAAE
jgi:hypothetical protein